MLIISGSFLLSLAFIVDCPDPLFAGVNTQYGTRYKVNLFCKLLLVPKITRRLFVGNRFQIFRSMLSRCSQHICNQNAIWIVTASAMRTAPSAVLIMSSTSHLAMLGAQLRGGRVPLRLVFGTFSTSHVSRRYLRWTAGILELFVHCYGTRDACD